MGPITVDDNTLIDGTKWSLVRKQFMKKGGALENNEAYKKLSQATRKTVRKLLRWEDVKKNSMQSPLSNKTVTASEESDFDSSIKNTRSKTLVRLEAQSDLQFQKVAEYVKDPNGHEYKAAFKAYNTTQNKIQKIRKSISPQPVLGGYIEVKDSEYMPDNEENYQEDLEDRVDEDEFGSAQKEQD